MYHRKKRKPLRPLSPPVVAGNDCQPKKSKRVLSPSAKKSQQSGGKASQSPGPVGRRTRLLIDFWRQKCNENVPPCNFTNDCPLHKHHHHHHGKNKRHQNNQNNKLPLKHHQQTPPLPVRKGAAPKPKNLKWKEKAKLSIQNICTKVKSPKHLVQRAFSNDESKHDYIPRAFQMMPHKQMQAPGAQPCLLIHNGSFRIKAGLTSETSPRLDFPNEVGTPKYDPHGSGMPVKSRYIGGEVDQQRRALKLRRTIQKGLISNWDDIEDIWDHTFERLRVDGSEYPLIMTESPQSSRRPEHRERIVELAFEAMNCPSFYLANQAAMSLYSSGKTTGIVAHLGFDMCYTVPVFEGRALPYATNCLNVGGKNLTRYLADLLTREKGYVFNRAADYDCIRDLKHVYGYCALDPKEESTACRSSNYLLPDGNRIEVEKERFEFSEALFYPKRLGVYSDGLHKMIVKSIEQADESLRNILFSNICMSGGTSLIPYLDERLLKEISMLDPGRPLEAIKNLDYQKDDKQQPKTRNCSVWTGAAMFATTSTFTNRLMQKSDYDEMGPSLIHRWCF